MPMARPNGTGPGPPWDPLGHVTAARRLSFLQTTPSVTSLLSADQLWQEGFAGQGVRMGVFDTGIREDHPHVKHIRYWGEITVYLLRFTRYFSRFITIMIVIILGVLVMCGAMCIMMVYARCFMWQGAHQLDARANAGRWAGAWHVCGGRGGRQRRVMSWLCTRRGALHLSRVHQRPGAAGCLWLLCNTRKHRCRTRRGFWTRSTMRLQHACTSSTSPLGGLTTWTSLLWTRCVRLWQCASCAGHMLLAAFWMLSAPSSPHPGA